MRGWIDLWQRLMTDDMDRVDFRKRAELLIREINNSEGMLRELRERKCNDKEKAVGGIIKYISGLGKELERDGYEGDMARAAFAFTSAKADKCRLFYEIKGVR